MENLVVWILLVLPSLLLIFIFILHFKLHYKIKCKRCICCIKCREKEKNIIQYTDECNLFCDALCKYSCIVGSKGPRFYPALFLVHLLMLLILYLNIIIRFIITGDTHKYCSIKYVSDHEFIFDATPLHENATIHNDFKIMDHIIIYLFIYVLLSDLYFNFLRYYQTMRTLHDLITPTQWFVFKRFSVFAIFFGITLVFEMYYYVLFMIIPILMFIFNLYCSYNFARILLRHYEVARLNGMLISFVYFQQRCVSVLYYYSIKHIYIHNIYIEIIVESKGKIKEVHQGFKNGAQRMKIFSIVSNVYIFLYFMGFTLCYHTSFVIYLPTFLSFSVLFGSLNFGQTRKFYYDIWTQLNFYIYNFTCHRIREINRAKQKHSSKLNTNPHPKSKERVKTPKPKTSYKVNTNSVFVRHGEQRLDQMNTHLQLTNDSVAKKSSRKVPKVLQLIGIAGAKQSLTVSHHKYVSSSSIELPPTKLRQAMIESKSFTIKKHSNGLNVKFKEPNSTPVYSIKPKKAKKLKEERLRLLEFPDISKPKIAHAKSLVSINGNGHHKSNEYPRLTSVKSDGNLPLKTTTSPHVTFKDINDVSEESIHSAPEIKIDDDFVTLDDYNPNDNEMDDLSYLGMMSDAETERKDKPRLLCIYICI